MGQLKERTVIALVVDVIASTKFGLDLDLASFRRYNRAFAEQIWPNLKAFALENAIVKFTGDGWLIFVPDLEKTSAVVALAKTLSEVHQKELAATLEIEAAKLPAIRLAICTGDDEEITLSNQQIEWIGDSARRATRAAGCCAPNQLIVNSTIRDKVYRAFTSSPIDIHVLPENQRPKRWEEDFQIYAIGDLRADFTASILADENPSDYAPYVTYLHLTGHKAESEKTFEVVRDAISDAAIMATGEATPTPVEQPTVPNIGAEMRKLLYVAPTSEMRDQVVRQMTKLKVAPSTATYNNLINRASSYPGSIEWFDRMRQEGVPPDVVTYSTLINLSPDLPTAREWYEEMRRAGIPPNEVTATSLAKSIKTLADADHLTSLLLAGNVFIGEGYYSALFSKLAETHGAQELLGWYVSQKYKRAPGLNGAIRTLASRHLLADACRIAFAFPYLGAARKVFRDHQEFAVKYFQEFLSRNEEPWNACYALGYCYLEGGRLKEALEMLVKALELSNSEKRSENIQQRIAEIRERIGKAHN